jgi:sugar O-acyltransferase (sialic acid O-acetyltransferase NeuD family)
MSEERPSLEKRMEIVIYGTGSSLLVDIEESLVRANVRILAAVRNRPGANFLSSGVPIFTPDAIAPEVLLRPFLIPFFTPGDRQGACREARAAGFAAAFSLVDPTAIIPRTWSLGEGAYINAGCTLGAGSRFGSFAFINRGATIGHHADFGDYVSIGPGAVLAGNIKMGDGAAVGAGAVVLPDLSIGRNAVVGAGAVVTRDLPEHCLAVGNPARIVKRDIAGFGDKSVTR